MRSKALTSQGADMARRVPANASLLWAQRNNPAWLEVRTFVATFRRLEGDAHAWESEDGHWAAELRRAPHGQHVYLALWRDGIFLGTYDQRHGWRPAACARARRSTNL